MSLEPKSVVEEVKTVLPRKPRFTLSVLHLPRNVYLLLFFTLGKGFQLANTVLQSYKSWCSTWEHHPNLQARLEALEEWLHDQLCKKSYIRFENGYTRFIPTHELCLISALATSTLRFTSSRT